MSNFIQPSFPNQQHPFPAPKPSDPTHPLELQHTTKTVLTLVNLQTNLTRNTPLPRQTLQQSPQHTKRMSTPHLNPPISEGTGLPPRRGSFMSARAKGEYSAGGGSLGRLGMLVEPGVCLGVCLGVETALGIVQMG